MIYDEASLDRHVHLRLDMPTVEQLARHPDGDLSAAARNTATERLQATRGDVDVYWLHAEIHQQHREVTISQVARFLLETTA